MDWLSASVSKVTESIFSPVLSVRVIVSPDVERPNGAILVLEAAALESQAIINLPPAGKLVPSGMV